MSCERCDEALDHSLKVYPFRLGTATIALIGCPTHVSIAMSMLREGIRKDEAEPDPASARDKDPG